MKNNSADNLSFSLLKQALAITMCLTAVVALYELAQACFHYQNGMSIFDFGSYATANMTGYCFTLILLNLIMLPMALMLYKQKDISLKRAICEKNTLARDIALGILGIAVSCTISLIMNFFVAENQTPLAFTLQSDESGSVIILKVIALTFVSGICKEIYFRGFAVHFAGDIFGETAALLLFNLLFGVLDWFNFGYSFLAGLVWIIIYKKSGHLIAPMIAHGGSNLVGIIYYLLI